MADFAWLVRRLKAMSIREVSWRISQNILQKREHNNYSINTAVTNSIFNNKLDSLKINVERMHLNLINQKFDLNTSIPLLGGYDYERYKNQWNAGFQTQNTWPLEFSYFLEYKQRDDIGDARTNWELNRHFQFALLAKDYAASGAKKYLDELVNLFNDWNEQNPFLWGIAWTSVMEVAIRCSNWCYTYCFLVGTNASNELLEKLRIGIINMTDYVVNHYSRFSSANNHLIVEAYAIGQTGVLCDYVPWIDLAVDILTRELPLQNYTDGVNKELSLHYQSFYMEAMGLMMRLMVKNGIDVPSSWQPMLIKMCDYLSNCIGKYGEVIEFGDNDEGKILDLHGGLNYYQYVLGLFSIMLPNRYCEDCNDCENLKWLFSEGECEEAAMKTLYMPPINICYREGGNTILRSRDGRVLIGIDHAALGFGSIAAHGHADALSFQMFVEGKPVLVDPGTYIYHCDLPSRNEFRKTINHNTVCIGDKGQSEMLGAFLWGTKAECKLLEYETSDNEVVLTAQHNGYSPIIHKRTFGFNYEDEFSIEDELSEEVLHITTFMLHPSVQTEVENKNIYLRSGKIILKLSAEYIDNGKIEIEEARYSQEYGDIIKTKVVRISNRKRKVKFRIQIGGKSYI